MPAPPACGRRDRCGDEAAPRRPAAAARVATTPLRRLYPCCDSRQTLLIPFIRERFGFGTISPGLDSLEDLDGFQSVSTAVYGRMTSKWSGRRLEGDLKTGRTELLPAVESVVSRPRAGVPQPWWDALQSARGRLGNTELCPGPLQGADPRKQPAINDPERHSCRPGSRGPKRTNPTTRIAPRGHSWRQCRCTSRSC